VLKILVFWNGISCRLVNETSRWKTVPPKRRLLFTRRNDVTFHKTWFFKSTQTNKKKRVWTLYTNKVHTSSELFHSYFVHLMFIYRRKKPTAADSTICKDWKHPNFTNVYVLLTVRLSKILDNNQLDTHLLYFTIRLLWSSTCFEHYMLIIRRLNRIDAAFGIVTLSQWPSGAQVEREQVCWQLANRSICSCSQAVSITCMTYTYCCVYSVGFLMIDREIVRNM